MKRKVLTLLALAAYRPRANLNLEVLTSLIKISMYSQLLGNTATYLLAQNRVAAISIAELC